MSDGIVKVPLFSRLWVATTGWVRSPVMTLISAALTIGIATTYHLDRDSLDLTERLEGQLLDLRFFWRGIDQPHRDIVIVGIDEKSLQQLGRWPLSRSIYADLVDRLAKGGAREIAFNLLFSEPETALPTALRDQLSVLVTNRENDTRDTAIKDLLVQASPDDQLASAFERAKSAGSKIVLPFAFHIANADSADTPKVSAPSGATTTPYPAAWAYISKSEPRGGFQMAFDPIGYTLPLPAFSKVIDGAGHASVVPENGGALRYDSAGVLFDGQVYPSFSIKAAAAFLGTPWGNVALFPGQQVFIGRHVPVDDKSRMVINYHGPRGTFTTYSLVDVINGAVPPGTFKNKLVLVGATGVGITDTFHTPFDDQLPSTELYASIIDRALFGPALYRPPQDNYRDLAAILILGAIVTLTAPRINLGIALVISASSLFIWGAICTSALVYSQLWLNMLFPSATVIATFASVVLMRGIAEERRRRQAEVSLRQSEERYALSARGANDGLWDWDLIGEHFYTSPRWHEIVGVEAAEVRSSIADWYDRVLTADLSALQGAVQAHLAGGSAHLEHEFRLRHADGSERWMLVRGLKVTDDAQKPVRMAGSMTDITNRKQSEQQLLFDALFDRLTGLANRASLRERTDFALQMRSRDPGRDAMVVIIDLDRFKDINDSLGIGTGDALLISVARALQQVVGPQDTLARLGEDEYGILRLFDGDVAAAIEELVPALQQAITRPFNIDGRVTEITASIGIAIASEAQASSAETLLADANLAVYRAKTLGRERAVKFEPGMQQSALKRLDMVSDLRQAVARGNELELFYQPIMRLQDGGIHGFEALIRWRHPTRGLVSPGDFIPIAEETGLIVEIGRRSIWQTCRQIAAWKAQTGFAPQVAVNVSGRQLETEAIVEDIRQALAETAIPTEKLKIEVTESMVMDNPERAQALLVRIMGLGVKISIDDFGTGYSSLSHLHRFPFNTLKIDRSFVIRMTENREGFEICKAIAKLAHILRRDVVAEGIETPEQSNLLRGLEVEYGQGYLFSKPLPVADATAFLQQQLVGKQQQAVSAQ